MGSSVIRYQINPADLEILRCMCQNSGNRIMHVPNGGAVEAIDCLCPSEPTFTGTSFVKGLNHLYCNDRVIRCGDIKKHSFIRPIHLLLFDDLP